MGFKYKKFSFTGGSEDFPVGDTDALRLQRAQTILRSAAEAILATDTGWSLDTSRNATITSFVSVPCMSGTKTFPGLFFKNTVSGCKLFIAYFCGSYAHSDIISNFGSDSNLYYISGTTATSGLITSIIPSGSSSEFGSSFNSSFLPADATRLCGTCFYQERTSSYSPAHGSNPVSGDTYTWGILATPYVIGVGAAKTLSISSPVYITGKIFGVLAHEQDTAINSKYGSVFFRMNAGPNVTEGWSGDIAYSSTLLSGTSIKLPGVPYTSNTWSIYECCGIFSKADGTWINGTNGNGYIVLLLTANAFLFSDKVSTNSTNTEWQPLIMLVRSSDLSTWGVVSGDGFKGLLDTELFRAGLGAEKATFDNGNFIKANSATYNNLILGWSPTGNDPY
jgi:hypothetical protein